MGIWPEGITERRAGAEWQCCGDRSFDLGDDMGPVHSRETIELSETLERLIVMFAGKPERHRLERKTRRRIVFPPR